MKTSPPFPHKCALLGNDRPNLIRPIQLNDEERLIDLFNHLSPASRYLRFAHAISRLPDDFLENILHLDCKKEMAFVAVFQTHGNSEEMIGIARYVTPPNQSTCEFSLSVSDSHTTHGIGTHLMLNLLAMPKKMVYKKWWGMSSLVT